MNFLCVGIKEVDAGKTTFALALMNYLKEEGEKVCGFKPRGGNDIWYDWPIVKESLEKGTLYGKDAKLLTRGANGQLPITLVNPGHRLWLPSYEFVRGGMPKFLFDRITIEDETIAIINKKVEAPIESTHFQKFFSESRVQYVSSRSDLREITRLYNKADAWAHSQLSQQFDSIVYESYANIGLPWQGISSLDYVFAVKPFHIAIYDGKRYLKAIEVLSTFPEEENVTRIIENLDPIQQIKVPPFSKEIISNLQKVITPHIDKIINSS